MNLRLGAACAVVDDSGRVLLSRRRDLNIWNLPGGRLDVGEMLAENAAREVYEETGIIAHVERAVGLYYWPGFRQMTVLFAGIPVGGRLRQETGETRENRYFPPDALPAMPRSIMTRDALTGTRHDPRVLHMSARDLALLRFRLRLRRLKNALRGHPEPPFAPVEVHAVAVIWDSTYSRVLTINRRRTEALPRVTCSGETPPWDELADAVSPLCGERLSFQWVGLWEDVERQRVEFVFAASGCETEGLPEAAAWSLARSAALPGREARYVARVKRAFATDPVWMFGREPPARAGDIVEWHREAI